MENNILLVGNGGHCESIIDTILSLNEYDKIAIVSKEKTDSNIYGIEVIGTDDDLPSLYQSGWSNAFVSVGSVGNIEIRKKLYNIIKDIGFNIPNIIDATAVVSKSMTLGEGNFIGKHAIVNIGTQIGNFCIINSGAVIEHDVLIEDFAHISTNSTLCGNVKIGFGSHIGAGSVIKQGITIGNNSLIGIGSVVTKDIDSNIVAFGNPCKERKEK